MPYGRIGLAAVAATAIALHAGAAQAEVSFDGKKINYIIASDAGGGTDRAARLFGQFLEKYLPGKPQMVYRNMGAGGGKIRAANYLMLQAERDGFTVMGTDSSPAGPTAARSTMSKFDPREFPAVGGIDGGGSVLFVRKDAAKRLNDPDAKPVIVGAINGTRPWNSMALWGKEFLGWNVKWITGYKGSSSLVKAIRQGEIDMFGTASSRRIDGLLKDGVIDLVSQEGVGPSDRKEPRGAYPDVPVMPDLMKGKAIPAIAREAYLGWTGATRIHKWVALPPKVPEQYVQAYRAAFNKAIDDPEFRRLVQVQISADAVYLTGEEIDAALDEVNGVSDKAMDYARDLRRKHDVSNR